MDLVAIAVCGAICECNSWEGLPRYGLAKRDWFDQLLELPNGIPSTDTFARVFQRLKPDEFLHCLSSVVAVLRTDVEQEVVAIDGQTLRGSGDDRAGRHPLRLVRAWATTNRLVLGQQACAEKSNEITAIPQLLKRTDIARTILEHGADYVLAVKGNQPKLYAEIRETFEHAMEQATSGQPPSFLEHVERQ